MLNTAQISVGTAAVRVLEPAMKPREVILHNGTKSSNEYIWFGGGSAVSISTGAHLDNADTYELTLQPGNELWAITDSGTRTLHVLWQEV